MSDVPAHHDMHETDSFTVHYPDHETRTETPEFVKTRAHLVHELDIGCFICGAKASQGAKNEAHHFYAEYAAMHAVDWAGKFAQEAHYMHNPQSGVCIGPKYDWAEVAKNPTLFVDSPDNMVVLCAEHHRDKSKGIHHVPFPVWILQRFPVAGFEFL